MYYFKRYVLLSFGNEDYYYNYENFSRMFEMANQLFARHSLYLAP